MSTKLSKVIGVRAATKCRVTPAIYADRPEWTHTSPDSATLRGLVGTRFSRERCAAPGFAPGPLTLAHLLLFHRRLDGDMATTRALVAVKTRCQSEQTRERKWSRRLGSRCARTIHVTLAIRILEYSPFTVHTGQESARGGHTGRVLMCDVR